MDKKIRVIIGKPGLDGHDRGAKVVAAALRDAGMEVIYTGLHQTCESIVEAAIQEDVDIIGLSILSGAHMTIFPKVINLLKKKGAKDIIVTGGGIIPEEDMKKLEKKGVKKMFGPGTPTTEIVDWINENVKAKAKKTKTKKIKKTKKAKKKRSVKKSKKLGKDRS
ncbi:MAG: cobalamin B12-binding domain-containing protein [Candidatus Stahlbacteria bacterium]|nr:MAG: cobalamin B12-binding domain-containing protein [Candidatus Stahlbacteria bacterium]